MSPASANFKGFQGAWSHIGGLLKQARLHFDICRFLEIAQADTNQAKALHWTKGHFLSQVESNFSQFLTSGWREGRSMAAGEDLEPACLELENYCPSGSEFPCAKRPRLFPPGVGSSALFR